MVSTTFQKASTFSHFLVELIDVQIELVAPGECFPAIAARIGEGARREVDALDVILCVRLLAVHFPAQRAPILGPTVAAAVRCDQGIDSLHIAAQNRAVAATADACNKGAFKA